jgi:hypothetical protein
VFRLDAARSYVPVDPGAIIALYQSVNSSSVLVPGQPSAAMARAVVAGHRLASGAFDVVIGLHLPDTARHLVFASDLGELDGEGARDAARDAIQFVEAMGFFMENANWRQLDEVARVELVASLKVFQPPPAAVVEAQAKVVDPRTKLARLLAQF